MWIRCPYLWFTIIHVFVIKCLNGSLIFRWKAFQSWSTLLLLLITSCHRACSHTETLIRKARWCLLLYKILSACEIWSVNLSIIDVPCFPCMLLSFDLTFDCCTTIIAFQCKDKGINIFTIILEHLGILKEVVVIIFMEEEDIPRVPGDWTCEWTTIVMGTIIHQVNFPICSVFITKFMNFMFLYVDNTKYFLVVYWQDLEFWNATPFLFTIAYPRSIFMRFLHWSQEFSAVL